MRQGLFAALKETLATLLGIGRTRLALLGNELQEEGQRLLTLLLLGLGALFFVGFSATLLVAWVAALFWQNLALVLGLFFGVSLLVTVVLVLIVAGLVRRRSALFTASLAELETDVATLRAQTRRPADR
jgi:uncharacterized membrane protein YqjE